MMPRRAHHRCRPSPQEIDEAARIILTQDIPRLCEEDTVEAAESAALAIGQFESLGPASESSILGVAPYPLSNPNVCDLVTLAESFAVRFPNIKGWKFGVSSFKDLRRFDPAHYDPRWFDKLSSLVLARDVVTNEKAGELEQCLIDLPFSVNHNASGIGSGGCQYSASFPAIIYAVPLNEGLSIAEFWATRVRARPPSNLRVADRIGGRATH